MIVPNLLELPIPTTLSSKAQSWISPETRKKWQKHQIAGIRSQIISVETVVCIITHNIRLRDKKQQHLTKALGTPIFGRKTNSSGDPNEITIIRAGIFDDMQILNERKPEAEIYTDRRLKWLSPIEGADQFSGMLPLSWYNYELGMVKKQDWT